MLKLLRARAAGAAMLVLLLDEPTSALDLRHQEMVLQWIYRLAHAEHFTVVFSTHHPQHADAVADEVALIHGPARIVVGPAAQMLDPQDVGTLFGWRCSDDQPVSTQRNAARSVLLGAFDQALSQSSGNRSRSTKLLLRPNVFLMSRLRAQ